MIVLGLESSCDETGAGIVELGTPSTGLRAGSAPRILANAIASQHATHATYGGVVPELASREHLKNLQPVVDAALKQAGLGLDRIDGLAVTYGPGLAGCLHLGLSAAKGLALATGKPWVGVNHLEGHLLAAFLEHADLRFPYVGLIVSGGHTSLMDVRSATERRRLEGTLDDAAGEAFDKVAKLLDLGFPGGPAVDKLAQGFSGEAAAFPSAKPKDGGEGFSYSGLKTSVRTRVEKAARSGQALDKRAVAAAFQAAAIQPLVRAAVEAAQTLGYAQVVAGGGVAANSLLRQSLVQACDEAGLQACLSSPALCADNGAMIAYAGGLRLAAGEQAPWDLGIAPSLTEIQ